MKRMEWTLIFTKYLYFWALNHTFDLLLGIGASGTIYLYFPYFPEEVQQRGDRA
ncbi:hypothetical protein MOD60_05885 [Bacillus spizizenii]|nr:hypothetical protein [Bacillus spizizenii]MCY7880683.1 hypothetical protein [Bacillus spizizenii]MCY7888694.1 hypothetical protein [Bacillus spizizenii]MCY8324653.1 hypothetical protein [Bacillus spizizenii]MCY8653991.1 hypothetical protein [Bacillus spizizenii]